MTDDLLDEATRLAGDYRNLDEGRVLRALVERVQQAEADVSWMTDCFTSANESCQAESRAKWEAMAERDEARGKLDKARTWLDDVYDDGAEWRDLRRLRAILDGKTY